MNIRENNKKKTSFFQIATSPLSIFEKSPYGDRIRLKENIHFHLYISKGPCGDASVFRKNNWLGHPDR